MAESKFPGGLVALGAVALCCALPALVVLASGALATALGAVIRFWPITIVGAALVTFGGTSLARKIQRGARGRPHAGGSRS